MGSKARWISQPDKSESKTGLEATVLLVDDQQFNLFALQQMFEMYGVVSDASLSGINAIELLTKRIDA